MGTPYDSLTRAQKRIYNRAITHHHERRIHLHVETLDGDPVASLTPVVLGGDIAGDVTSSTSIQVLSIRFLDPHRMVNFEPANPGGASLHRSFQLVVVDSRRIVELDDWIDYEVHTGPIWDFDRQGAEVSLTAHARDRLAKGTVRHPRQFLRKAKNTDVIRALLRASGAVAMRIPDLPSTLGHQITIGFAYRHHQVHHKAEKDRKAYDTTVTERVPRTDHYDEVAQRVAHADNLFLYTDGSGVWRCRPHPEKPVLTIDRALLTEPQVGRPGKDSPNVWQVLGDKPKGDEPRVQSPPIALPPKHPLSPEELAVNDKPYVVLERIENPHCKRTAQCVAIARRHRDRAARIVTTLEVDLLPIPWLQPYDLIVVPTTIGSAIVQMKQWTYPLGPDNTPMHIGSTVVDRPPHGGEGR